jgi:transposase
MILPLGVLVASANDNEKKHASSLVERTRGVLNRANVRLRRIIGDSQYSSGKVRELADEAVIPYTSNQKGEGVLRVDRRFRTYGPAELRREYHKRPMVESAFSFLKTQYGLAVNKVRDLANVSVYVLLSVFCHVLVREAAENMGRVERGCLADVFQYLADGLRCLFHGMSRCFSFSLLVERVLFADDFMSIC